MILIYNKKKMRFGVAILLGIILGNSAENQPVNNLNEPLDVEAKEEGTDPNATEMPEIDENVWAEMMKAMNSPPPKYFRDYLND